MSADCVTLWIGERLGAVERACLRSVIRQGHSLALYCYEQPTNVPDGVEVEDAEAVLPQGAIPEDWRARADLYSDWFRYRMLRLGLGTWVDTDIYLLGRLNLDRPYLFGEQAPGILNNAVLRAPSESALLDDLLDPFERKTTPRWLPHRHYWPMRLREALTGSTDLLRAPWGTTSPHALTALTRKHGLTHLAEPKERFYPVPWQKADWVVDPEARLEDRIGRDTVAVHLWNERIKAFKDKPAPSGSFLARLQDEGAAA